MTDEDVRVREYLVSQAARYDLLTLWPRVLADRTAFLGALDRLSERQAEWHPSSEADDAWSILEVARHSLDWSQSVTEIVEALAMGETAKALPLGHIEPMPPPAEVG